MKASGVEFIPVWQLQTYDQQIGNDSGKPMEHTRFLDMANPPDVESDGFEDRSTNYYRSDDVSASYGIIPVHC